MGAGISQHPSPPHPLPPLSSWALEGGRDTSEAVDDDRGKHSAVVNLRHNHRHLYHLGEHQHQQLLPRLLHALPHLHALEQALLLCFLWQSPSGSVNAFLEPKTTDKMKSGSFAQSRISLNIHICNYLLNQQSAEIKIFANIFYINNQLKYEYLQIFTQ